MESRFPLLRLFFLLLLSCLTCMTYAQQDAFTINYTGPDTLFVGDTCEVVLDWGHPSTVDITTIEGILVDSIAIETISGGLSIGALVQANQELFITYFARDTTGRSAVLSDTPIKIVIADTIAPTFINVPNDTVVNCDAIPSAADILARDNCDDSLKITLSESLDTIGTTIQLTRVWTTMDTSNNITIDSQILTITDTIPPQLLSIPSDTMVACDAIPEMPITGDGGITAMDNCDAAVTISTSEITTQNSNPDSCAFYNYMITRTWIAEDFAGNRDSVRQVIAIADTLPPTFTIPRDTMIACEFRDSVELTGQVTNILDNCDTNPIIRYTDSLLAGNCQGNGILDTLLRIWIVSDICGNIREATQQIILIDSIPPAFTAFPIDTMLSCGDTIAPTMVVNNLSATDNCSDVPTIQWVRDSINRMGSPSDCSFYNYTLFRTWAALDDCENRTVITQTIQIIDTVAPNFIIPKDTIIGCEFRDDLDFTGEPTNVMDNCDASPVVNFTDFVVGGNCTQGEAIDTIFRTWRVEDVCGNINEAIQQIILIDTVPPMITGQSAFVTLQCAEDSITLPEIGIDIVATDNCGMVPLLQLISTTNDRANAVDDCNFYNYTITRTWRATDGCNNQTNFIQTIEISDTIAPNIICPDDITLAGDSIDCTATFTLPQPYFFDDCNGLVSRDSFVISQDYSHDMNGDVNVTPIDTLVYTFDIGNTTPFKTITGNITLTIDLLDSDIEGEDEYFLVLGEDGRVLGRTNNAENQCDASLTELFISDIGLFNSYAADGMITFTLIPNGTGTAAINNVCPDGRARLALTYDFTNPLNTHSVNYTIDNGAFLPFQAGTEVTLGNGNHIITYFVADCSGNEANCTINVSIDNLGAPEFQCPDSVVAFLDTAACELSVDLPFPSNFEDNCGFSNNVAVTTASFLTFTNNATVGLIPMEITDSLLVGDVNPISDAILTVTLRGDVSDEGEFFNIFGENGFSLGNTVQSGLAGECVSNVQTEFIIPIDTFINWSADGIISLTARPNQDAANFSDFINPCGTLDTQNIDLNSEISWQIAYPSVIIDYQVINSDSTPIGTGFLTSSETIATEAFPVGLNTVIYTIQDLQSPTQCSFTVDIRDTIAPIAICRSTFNVKTNPSGLSFSETNIETDSIFSELSDNCDIGDISINPRQVSCDSVGLVNAIITVSDLSGNQATCSSQIQVSTEIVTPTFSLGACDNDTLYLFADTTFATPIDPDAFFVYEWSGPANFSSISPNPIIPNVSGLNSGNYGLTITGESGCTTSGSVFVDINELDIPIIQTENLELCENENIILTTNNTNCANIAYRWFEVNNAANQPDSIVAITQVPQLTIANPTVGEHAYYLIIACDECTSSPSATLNISTFDIPIAETNAEIVEVCEGEAIQLGVSNVDPLAAYSWIGPSYTSNSPNPDSISNATLANQGVYTLVVSKNDCTSETDFTIVNVKERAERPTIISPTGTSLCEGEEFILLGDVTIGSNFNWQNLTNSAAFTTTTPSLQIDSINASLAGDWVLSITSFGCESEVSNSINLVVENNPISEPFFTGSACEGGTIQLDVNPPLAGATYEWLSDNGVPYTGRSPSVAVEESYSVTITSLNNCQSVDRLAVEIEEPPIITTIVNSGNAAPCITPNETEIILSATVFPVDEGNYTYSWILPDGTILAPNVDSFLLIQNTNAAAVNGVYSLTVQTNNGCVSEPVTETVSVTDLPTPNPSLTANASNFCAGERLQLTTTTYDDFAATYHWRLPTLDTFTTTPILIIDPVTMTFNGIAQVEVSNGSCTSLASATVNIQVSNGIEQPAIFAPNTYCAGETIELRTDEVANATYFWEGPDFSATSTTPNIIVSGDAEVEQSGDYTVRVQSSSCRSSPSLPLTITVTSTPTTPIVNNSGNVCLEIANEVTLFITQQSAIENSIVTWFDAVNDQSIANPNTSNTFILDVNNFVAGTYQYYAVQEVNGCPSAPSNTTEVVLQNVPTNQAVVCEANVLVCNPEEAVLCAETPTEGTGAWTVNDSDIQILSPNEPQTNVQGIRPGEIYTFTWTLSDPICGDYSFSNLVMRVSATNSSDQVCESLIELCEVTSHELCANALPNQVTGEWSQPEAQANLGVVIEEPTNPNTTISSIEAGNPFNLYFFYWTIMDENGSCPIVDTVQVNVYAVPNAEAMVVDNDLIACQDEIMVNAVAPPTGVLGRWSSEDKDLIFSSLSDNSITISNLQPGDNRVSWNISAGACGEFSSETVAIFYEQSPIAQADEYTIAFNGMTELPILDNDELFSEEFTISILSNNLGEAVVNDSQRVVYNAPTSFRGTDEFTYEICSDLCPNACSSADVTLTIGDNAECIAPTIFTPNGDGVNDAFVIPCLENGGFPRSEVSIFNQWGDELFRASPYQNDWEGTYNGNDVPVGTYYYIVQLRPSEEPMTGFLVLER